MIQYGHHSQIRVCHRSCLDNIFFAIERKKIIQEQEHADGTPVKVGFANMANIVSERWKNIDPEYKEELERVALVGNEKYDKDTLVWKLKRIGRTMGNNEEGRMSTCCVCQCRSSFQLELAFCK
jgi:hypothetical protein